MHKRAAALFFIYCLLMSVVCLQLTSLVVGGSVEADEVKNTRSIELSDLGAPIYDCKGRLITNGQSVYYAAAKPTSAAVSALEKMLDEDAFEKIKSKLEKGSPAVAEVLPGTEESDDIKIIGVSKRYYVRQPAAHVVGYTDIDGNGVCGIEKSFESIFKNNRQTVSAVFSVDANGCVMPGGDITVCREGDYKNSGVYLTLDIDIQRIVEECMDDCGIEQGAVVVLDPSSGAIRAMASRPVFDSNDPSRSLGDTDSPFVDRALSAFAVGSVFKPAIACAALEQGIDPSLTYECTGSIKVGDVEFGCYEHHEHGKVDMCGALEKSCNAYFINLAQKLNTERMIGTLSDLGFGKSITLCDGISSAAGSLPDTEQLDSPAAVSNLAFGQGTLTATPLQVAAYMSAIANNGIYITPYLVEKAVDGEKSVCLHEARAGAHAVSEETAKRISSFLCSAVENGNGSGAKPEKVSAAGKTATAQTGRYENGQELYNTWFAGWFPAESPKYVIAVLKERGAGGASDCAPVFKAIADRIEENLS